MEYFRYTRPGDLPGIMKLEKECFTSPWSVRMITFHILSSAAFSFSLMSDEELAGYIMGMPDDGSIHITNLAVAPDFRRKGYASFMIGQVKELAWELGIGRIFLEVRENNLAAIALYEKEGFTLCGREEGYYEDSGEAALIMEFVRAL